MSSINKHARRLFVTVLLCDHNPSTFHCAISTSNSKADCQKITAANVNLRSVTFHYGVYHFVGGFNFPTERN